MQSLHNILKGFRFYASLFFDKETPWFVKALLAAGLGYLVFPFDFIPDQIPVLGIVDDLTIVSLLVTLALRLVPPGVARRVKNKMNGMKNG